MNLAQGQTATASGLDFVGSRYMAGFKCIGPDCESNCCHSWGIAFDQESYKRLERSLGRNRKDREIFRQSFQKNDNSKRSKVAYAMIKRLSHGACPFLDERGLCGLHCRFGHVALGQVCRTFPKTWRQFGRRIELSGDLSCPEVSRRLLLNPDAMERFLMERPTQVSNLLLADRLAGKEMPPYIQYLDDIRQVGSQLLEKKQYPLASQLFFLACFADLIAPFFHKNTDNFHELQLAASVASILSADTQAELDRELQALDPRTNFSLDLVGKIMMTRAKDSHGDFCALLEKVLNNGVDGGEQRSVDNPRPPRWNGGTFQENFERRKQIAEQMFAERLNLFFANYCRNYWLNEWYVTSSSPSEHVRRLLVRLAVIRVMLFCHPGLNGLLERDSAGPVAAEDADRLDQVAVEVFTFFSRGVEHSREYLDLLHKFLSEQGLEELALQAMLLKV